LAISYRQQTPLLRGAVFIFDGYYSRHIILLYLGALVKNFVYLVVTLFTFLSINVSAANRYVSDQLFTYMHKGPSAQYRIVGSLNAGTKIKLLQSDKKTGYSKVQDPRGRSGWISTKFVTSQEPSILRLPEAVEALDSANKKLNGIADSNKAAQQKQQQSLSEQIASNQQLVTQRQQLLAKIQALELDNTKLQTRIANQSEEVEMYWFMRGAAIIIMGIFIGLVLPLIPRRKKKNDVWA